MNANHILTYTDTHYLDNTHYLDKSLSGMKKSYKSCIKQWPTGPYALSWWRHQMETFSALLAICAGISPVTGEFPAQRPVTRSFDVFFELRLNKRLSWHSWGWWFGTPLCQLWRQCNVTWRIAPKTCNAIPGIKLVIKCFPFCVTVQFNS